MTTDGHDYEIEISIIMLGIVGVIILFGLIIWIA